MARTRIIEAPAFKSWEDVNGALREIALEEIALADIDGEMNQQIIGIKKVAEQDAKPHNDRIARLAKDINEFVSEHRDDLGKRKTKTLTFGECGFRQSTTITVPAAKDKLAEVIRRLRARKMTDCIAVKETVNKDILRQHGEEKVVAVGATWKQKDVFWYEAARDKLERLRAGQR